MKKRTHKYNKVLLTMATALALTACDEVDQADRYISVAPQQVERAVLIEDFTGQRCVNCPNATAEIEKLKETYGEQIIAVGIHSGPFAHRSTISSPRLPLGTELGDDYFRHWGVQEQPTLVVNRNGQFITNYQMLSAAVIAEMERSTSSTLSVACRYDDSSRQLHVEASGFVAQTAGAKLQVWITEDSIVNPQLMPDGSSNSEYVHNHVFRSSVTTDPYGDTLLTNSATDTTGGASYSNAYDTKADSSWNVDNLYVVAFVYNDKEGVMQVVRQKVISQE